MLQTLDEENTEMCEYGGKNQTAANKSTTGMLSAVKAGVSFIVHRLRLFNAAWINENSIKK
jgi:hypothetical protein